MSVSKSCGSVAWQASPFNLDPLRAFRAQGVFKAPRGCHVGHCRICHGHLFDCTAGSMGWKGVGAAKHCCLWPMTAPLTHLRRIWRRRLGQPPSGHAEELPFFHQTVLESGVSGYFASVSSLVREPCLLPGYCPVFVPQCSFRSLSSSQDTAWCLWPWVTHQLRDAESGVL